MSPADFIISSLFILINFGWAFNRLGDGKLDQVISVPVIVGSLLFCGVLSRLANRAFPSKAKGVTERLPPSTKKTHEMVVLVFTWMFLLINGTRYLEKYRDGKPGEMLNFQVLLGILGSCLLSVYVIGRLYRARDKQNEGGRNTAVQLRTIEKLA